MIKKEKSHLQYTHEHTMYSQTHIHSAKCLHRMYLRRENQCLLAFKALHSHLLQTVVFFRSLFFASESNFEILPHILSVLVFPHWQFLFSFQAAMLVFFYVGSSSVCSDPRRERMENSLWYRSQQCRAV